MCANRNARDHNESEFHGIEKFSKKRNAQEKGATWPKTCVGSIQRISVSLNLSIIAATLSRMQRIIHFWVFCRFLRTTETNTTMSRNFFSSPEYCRHRKTKQSTRDVVSRRGRKPMRARTQRMKRKKMLHNHFDEPHRYSPSYDRARETLSERERARERTSLPTGAVIRIKFAFVFCTLRPPPIVSMHTSFLLLVCFCFFGHSERAFSTVAWLQARTRDEPR